MHNNLSLSDAYDLITKGIPRIFGKDFDPAKENYELMVVCVCKETYIVELNAERIIDANGFTIPTERSAFHDDDSLYCPHCERSSKKWRALSTHSGGVFNFGEVRTDIV